MKKTILLILTALIFVSSFIFIPQSSVCAATDEKLVLEYLKKNSDYPKAEKEKNSNYTVNKFGKLGKYNVFYGKENKESNYKNVKKIKTAGFTFKVYKKIYPYELGVYLVIKNKVYTLSSAYSKGKIGKADVYYTAVKLFNRGEKVNWKMTAKPALDSSLEGAALTKLKSGKSKQLKSKNIQNDWKSSNEKIAIVKNGKVTALKKGSCVVKRVNLLESQECPVKVISNPELSVKSIVLAKNKTKTIKLYGKAESIKNKYYSNSKAKFISKRDSKNIKIKGLKKGKTTLKIKVNGVKTLKLKVKVR